MSHILGLNMTSESNSNTKVPQTFGNPTALQLSLNFTEISNRKFRNVEVGLTAANCCMSLMLKEKKVTSMAQ